MGSEWRQSTWGDEVSLEYGKALRLLAACGGQGTDTGNGAPGSLDTKASNTNPTGNETSPLTKDSVRGDVIKAALLQSPNLFPQKDGPPIVVYASAQNYPIHNHLDALAPPFTTDEPMQLLQIATRQHDTPALGQQVISHTTFTANSSHTFNSVRLHFGLNEAGDGLEIGRVLDLASLQGNEKRPFADSDRQSMSAEAVKVIRDKDRIPLSPNSSIQLWKAANPEHSTRLYPLATANEQSFSLCLDAEIERYNRITCTKWKIPDNWTSGQPLQFVDFNTREFQTVEDINGPAPHRDITISFGWEGAGDMAHMLNDPASAPLSDKGVSGAALSAMLDSWTKAQGSNPEQITLQASSGPDTSAPPSTEEPQSVVLYQHDQRAWADNAPLDHESYKPAAGHTDELTIESSSSRTPDGTLALEIPEFSREYLNLRYAVTLVDQKPAFLLGELLFRAKPSRPFAARLDALVPFGELNVWNASAKAETARLELRRHPDADKAELCWTLGEPAHREICQTWQIPGDWQWGKPLRMVSARVMNDRTTEGGNKRYWQWTATPDTEQPQAPATAPARQP